MFAPDPEIQTIPIAPGHVCLVIDNALSEPERWVELAAVHQADFAASSHNAYPGGELRMPDAISARLDEFFARHIRARLGARRTVRMYSRLALATRQPAELEPRQWICHRDRLDTAPERCVAASVLYLFKDAALGGTSFFVPRRDPQQTALLVHESGTLAADEFARKYNVARNYLTESNDWFEHTATIQARWNRLIFYDGGAVFHCSHITEPQQLNPDPRDGRLTLNGFFICRRSIS